MTNNNFSQVSAFIWSATDLLRGDFRQSEYGRIILPFTLLRRLECVLEPTKANVLEEYEKVKALPLPEEVKEKLLLKSTQGLAFFNTSELDLFDLDRINILNDLYKYIYNFSQDVREIFEHFMFDECAKRLDNANLLYKVVQKFAYIDLSPETIPNHEMGLVFEELIRRVAECSNETAGEHFTPRDIVRLSSSLVFNKKYGNNEKTNVIRTVYDPATGTGGFLSGGIEYFSEYDPNYQIQVFGQELNPESYAICKANMLIKGQVIRNIKLGNTLSNDQLAHDKFDYMLSAPPFGMNWKKIEHEIKDEHEYKGFNGRFGAGLPRVSDSSLLFLMHLISKMRQPDQGSRIGIILNGSPLFTGTAGSGESEVRRYILEADLLEAIIALPTDMFYNTSIATYVWVLSNKKEAARKGKVHLINAVNLSSKMRKSLGSKRNYLTDAEIATITKNYGAFEAVDTLMLDGESDQQKPFASKIFNSYEFGYRRVTIERPLRLSAQLSDERIENLRFAPKPFNEVMQSIYSQYADGWTADSYGDLSDVEAEIRALIKAEFTELKEKDIKTLLEPKLWLEQRALLNKAKSLQAKIGTEKFDDFNNFDFVLKQAFKDTSIKLKTKDKKHFVDTITWKNADAEPVINKVLKTNANPLYGQFEYQGKVVEFEQDSDLRDAENIDLDPSQSTTDLIESYFKREVQPHVPDAWINADKRDVKDGEIGTVGYEINFYRKFASEAKLELENENILRIKNVINIDKDGEFVLNRYSGEIIFFSDVQDKSYSSNLTRFNVNGSILNYQYYNIFLSLPEGKDWLDSSVNVVSIIRNINFNNWINLKLNIPKIKQQLEIVDFFKECDVVLEQINLLKNSSLSYFDEIKHQITPYLEVAERYENEFSTILPTPLAILWELADSKFNKRDTCEAFLKFYEYMGVYLLSIAYGNKYPVENKIYKGNGGVKSITMAYSYQRLKEIINQDTECCQKPLNSFFLNNNVVKFLEETTVLRNDIAHRGLPSASDVSHAFSKVEQLNKEMNKYLREFFAETDLISPIQSQFDGEYFVYEVNVMKGLGMNPCRTQRIKTQIPLISKKLYLVNYIKKDEQLINESSIIEIFPFVILEESIENSELNAFYFYSDVLEDENNLRYICPYPNIETVKLKNTETFKKRCRN